MTPYKHVTFPHIIAPDFLAKPWAGSSRLKPITDKRWRETRTRCVVIVDGFRSQLRVEFRLMCSVHMPVN